MFYGEWIVGVRGEMGSSCIDGDLVGVVWRGNGKWGGGIVSMDNYF